MPDVLLPESTPAKRHSEAGLSRGRLTIFFGMAPGVGKSLAMVQSAQLEKRAGRDVVVASLNERRWAETLKSAESLPRAGNAKGNDFDLDATLARRPQLAIVDELAHANSAGARHPHRYQDVLELLEAGIDVFATMDIRDVASRADIIWEITGVPASETVPDSTLDFADLRLVDMAPRELLQRVAHERSTRTAETDLHNPRLWQESTLLILREMTARLFSERVGQQVRAHMQDKRVRGPLKSGRKLMAAIGPGPNSEQLVRHTRRLAASLNAPWVVLHVETSHGLSEQEQLRLNQSLALAQELGAEVFTTTDDNLVAGILRVAEEQNITQINVGKPLGGPGWKTWRRDLMLRSLVRGSGQMDVQVILANKQERAKASRPERPLPAGALMQYLLALAVVTVVTMASLLLVRKIGPHAVALVFLLAVVVLAVFVRPGPALFAAGLSALSWDYFFLSPRFALLISDFEDAMMFAMYFIVASVLGQLTARIRAQQEAERQREARATALYLLAAELNSSTSLDLMVKKLVRQMEVAFDAHIALFLPDTQNVLNLHPASDFQPDATEHEAPVWVQTYGRPAGKFTDNLPDVGALYVPLATSSGMMGVVGLRFHRGLPPSPDRRNLLDVFCQQIALALDRHRLNEVSEKSRLLAESERLSKTLLDSMSHEMRTPLAAILSATGNLAALGRSTDSPLQREMLGEIREAAQRLDHLVGNVLEATRVESGNVKPKINECDVAELVNLTVAQTEKELARHKLEIQIAADLPLVPLDFVLTQQALSNLLSNAARHTPPGTAVQVSASVKDDTLQLVVADRGPGLSPDILPRIFDKFYRAPNAATGGTGLGLSLVKGFVEAQHGTVAVENVPAGGLRFTIRLPVRKDVGEADDSQLISSSANERDRP